ncbi:hypothetical protein SGCOL_000134 [Colletotrichum sp. CLE4]
MIDLATALFIEGLLTLAKVAKSKALPALSWNHAKVTAASGTAMTTGGANLWDSYGDTQVWTFDSMFKIRGDAAIEAHKYADALWRQVDPKLAITNRHWHGSSYLNNIPSDDNASFRHSIKLSGPTPTGSDSFQADAFPLFGNTKQSVKNNGSQAVLTTRNVGDRLPGSGKHRYPILVLNIVNPAVWASKAARFHAIESATSNITLAQEIFVEPFLRGNLDAGAIKQWLKSKLGLDWDE